MILLSSVLIYKHVIALCIHCNVRDFTWPYHVLLWLLYLTPDCLMCITDLIVLPAVLIICIRDYALPLPIYLQLSAGRSYAAPNYFPFLPLNIYAWLCMFIQWWCIDMCLCIDDDWWYIWRYIDDCLYVFLPILQSKLCEPIIKYRYNSQ